MSKLTDFLKGVGGGIKKALPVLEALFPQLEIVERLAHFKDMTGDEKKKTALDLFSSKLLDQLLPDQVDVLRNDPVFNSKISSLIDSTIDLENYVKSKFPQK